jgi:hypothetical protein
VRVVNEQLNPNATRGYQPPAHNDREDFDEEEEEEETRGGNHEEEDELRRE